MTDAATRAPFTLGDAVPSFRLPDTNGVEHAVPAEGDAPPATVVIVTCNHCPYVIAWNPRLRAAAEDYLPRGVRFLQINSNDAARYPADSYARMQEFVRDQGWPIPYLHDESQDVARALGAVATPHVYVLDREHRLRYQGAPDPDHRDDSHNAVWVRAALDAVLAEEEVETPETPVRGCSVKWR
jgi:peroxiredoxin